ncbi:hypothetical protein EK904_009987 [Melospiza melodia maxima]|nr:hypothetical protein EK904_009987 [Melospiza melodia maxima]
MWHISGNMTHSLPVGCHKAEFPHYSQIFPRLFEGRSPWTLPVIVQTSHASPQASATRLRSWWHPTPSVTDSLYYKVSLARTYETYAS